MTNYISGRRLEYKAKEELEKNKYVVIRASGSHGVFDLIAIRHDIIRLIQIKKTRKKVSYGKEIEGISKLDVPKSCRKELWIWEFRKGWKKLMI